MTGRQARGWGRWWCVLLALCLGACDTGPGGDASGGEAGGARAPEGPGDGGASPDVGAVSGPSGGGPDVTVRTLKYPVRGRSGLELRESLLRRGREMEGEVAHGWTEWSVDVGYAYERTGDRCRLTRPDVDLRITVHVPRWSPPTGVAGSTVVRWNRYVRGIRRHEEEHVRIAREAADAVYRGLDSLPPGDCGSLRRRVDGLADSVLGAARRRQDRFDRVTDHGRDAEATWPPP